MRPLIEQTKDELIQSIWEWGVPQDDLAYGEMPEYGVKFPPIGGELRRGLWQIPEQFADFCIFLRSHKIKTFMEVGTSSGYTISFITTMLGIVGKKYVSIDKTKRFTMLHPNIQFWYGTSDDWKNQESFDAVFIDGDHKYNGVRADWDNVGEKSNVMTIFHDIVSPSKSCDGVRRFWNELEGEKIEFTACGEKGRNVGIGVLMK